MLRGIHKFLDKSNWEEARAAVKTEDVSVPGGFGHWTPLHIACKRNPPIDIIESLIELSADSLDKFDSCNRLPIHYAADSGVSAEVYQVLVEACPKSILGVDDEGLTPLHLVFRQASSNKSFPSADVISILSSNQSVWIADTNDKIPLHYAAMDIDHLSSEQIKALTEKDPDTVLAQTSYGMTALHLALQSCSKEIPDETIKALLGLSPDGKKLISDQFDVTRIMCDKDMLPLHYACEKQMFLSVEVFRLILQRCPEAASTSARYAGFPLNILETTLESTMSRSHDFTLKSDMIFAYNPTLSPFCSDSDRLRRIGDSVLAEISNKGSLNDINKSLWIWMCSLPEEEDRDGIAAGIIDSVLVTFKDAKSPRFLCTIETMADDDQVVPLFELVSPKTRQIMSNYVRIIGRFSVLAHRVVKSPNKLVFKAIDDFADTNKNVDITFFSNSLEFKEKSALYQRIQSEASRHGFSTPIVPMIAMYEFEVGKSFFDDFEKLVNYDKSFDMSSFQYVIVTAEKGNNLKPFSEESNSYTQKKMKNIAEILQSLHRCGFRLESILLESFCEIDEKVLLCNTDFLTHLSTSKRTQYCGAIDRLEISKLPPEMICKLTNRGVLRYETYWKDVIDDFFIASDYTEEEARESSKFQSHLKAQNISFEEFWDRIQINWNLWMKIRPRRVEGDFYVIKCFRYENSNETIEKPDDLPYELVEWNENVESWYFASFFFEQTAGESLFHIDKNKVFINQNDFQKLCDWSMMESINANRTNSINDPFARDFLRVTLTLKRLPNMDAVLGHSYFSEIRGESLLKGYLAYEKVLKQNALVQDELKQKTKNTIITSMETLVKFEHSVWRQLSWQHKADEVKHPVSYIFLPYAIQSSSGSVSALGDKSVPRIISVAIIDILHYAHLLNRAKQSLDQVSKPSMEEFFDVNIEIVDSEEKSPLQICKEILMIGKNVELLLTSHFENYIGLSKDHARTIAQKLVSESLQGEINFNKCKEIVKTAEEAFNAMSSLIDMVGSHDTRAAESMLNRHFSEICRGRSFELTVESKRRVYEALLKMFEKFSHDPLLAIQSLLDSAFISLLNPYSSRKECYVYAVDEYTGLPLVRDDNPSRIQLTSDTLKAFIPTTLLVAKTHFFQGIHRLFGDKSDYVVTEQNNALIGNISMSDSEAELSLIQETLNKFLRSKKNFQCGADVLDYLQRYHYSIGGEEKYFGLQRLSSSNEMIIWTRVQSQHLIQLEGEKTLRESIVSKRKTVEKYEKIPTEGSVSSMDSNISETQEYHTSVSSTQETPLISIQCDTNSPKAKDHFLSTMEQANPAVNSIMFETSRDYEDQPELQLSNDSNTIESIEVSESGSSSLMSRSKDTDDTEGFCYSSSDSEKSHSKSSTNNKSRFKKSNRSKRDVSLKVKFSKPFPGDQIDVAQQRRKGVELREMDKNENIGAKVRVDVSRFKRKLKSQKRERMNGL